MRIEHDPDVDVAYIRLVGDIPPGEVSKTVPVEMSGPDLLINLDLDIDGRLIGIEVLSASSALRPETLSGGQTP